MSTYLYDEAFVSKLNRWCGDTNLHIYGPDESSRLFEVIADETNDKPIQLPLISLSRDNSLEIINTGKIPLSHKGIRLKADDNSVSVLNAIPINIKYQIDVYARYFREADEYIRNIVFNIVNYNKLEINIPYRDVNYRHNGTIRIISDITNNSNIPERLIPGQFTRFTFNVSIDDAYLWDVKLKKPKVLVTGGDEKWEEVEKEQEKWEEEQEKPKEEGKPLPPPTISPKEEYLNTHKDFSKIETTNDDGVVDCSELLDLGSWNP